MKFIQPAEVLFIVAMRIEYNVTQRRVLTTIRSLYVTEQAMTIPSKDVTECFPNCVAMAKVGLTSRRSTMIIRLRDYGDLEAYAATSFALFLGTAIKEVFKVGTAVYKVPSSPEDGDREDVRVGDVAIMGGSHSRPILTVVNDDYGIPRR